MTFSLDAYRFDVPKELIAQFPANPRDSARLMIVHRTTGAIEEGIVADIPSLLSPHDVMVLNNTRVLHAALCGKTEHHAPVHILLTRSTSPRSWHCMAKPARRLAQETTIHFPHGITATVVDILPDGQRALEFSHDLTPDLLQSIGTIPLPPYIHRKAIEEIDALRYQTIYGEKYGAVAAPTAGLHFTETLFSHLQARQITTTFVTLHVGTGTFLPIRTDDIRMHEMHVESFEVPQSTADLLNRTPPSCRRLAVGTTSLRVLETVAASDGHITAGHGTTNLFIYPGYHWKFVNALFTNFHTPESSLLVLVSSFMGYELMVEAYRKAIERKFRLFSYGDAMLIL
jgi:S-adenosylmethionine:tRNA ribosyltransferase-isomerase